MLTEREKKLFDSMSHEEYQRLVVAEARRRLNGASLCVTNISKITKQSGFESSVSMLVDNSHGWI